MEGMKGVMESQQHIVLGLLHPRRIPVQGTSIMHSNRIDMREYDQEVAMWRIMRTLWD